MMEKPKFAAWLGAEDKSLCGAFRNASGKPARMVAGDLPEKVAKLRSCAAKFDRFEKDLAELLKGGSTSRPGPTAEPMPEADSLVAALAKTGRPEDARAAERFRTFLSQHGSNAQASATVAEAIRTNYPALEPAGNEELARLLRHLEERARARLDRPVIEAIARSASFYKSDLAEGPDALAERTREDAAGIVPMTAHDRQLQADIPSLAAALAMHRMHVAIETCVTTARRESIPLPVKALRSLLLWPRDSDMTWSLFTAFERLHQGKLGGALSGLSAEFAEEASAPAH